MFRNYASEALPRHKLHHLCEQRLAYVHAILRVVETQKHRKTVSADSNRGHPQIVRNHTQYCTYNPPQTNEPDTSGVNPQNQLALLAPARQRSTLHAATSPVHRPQSSPSSSVFLRCAARVHVEQDAMWFSPHGSRAAARRGEVHLMG
jgi:hypothetical protein